MLAEISVQPQVGRDIRREIARAVEVIRHAGLKYEVGAFGTVVQGELEQILAVINGIHGRLLAEGVERFDLGVRLREEPGGASIEREKQGFGEVGGGEPGLQSMPGLEQAR